MPLHFFMVCVYRIQLNPRSYSLFCSVFAFRATGLFQQSGLRLSPERVLHLRRVLFIQRQSASKVAFLLIGQLQRRYSHQSAGMVAAEDAFEPRYSVLLQSSSTVVLAHAIQWHTMTIA